jgi:beta-lactamase superfamily II metal-dependent hydrolase
MPMLASAQDAPAPPLHADANGEEVFGPNYMPIDPPDPGEPLQPGRPKGGIQFHKLTPQTNNFELTELVTTPQLAIPFRRSVRLARKIPRIKVKLSQFEKLTPLNVPMALPMQPLVVSEMIVHYVNVGQGSGAVLEFPCGVAVIDTGGEYASGGVNGGKEFVDYLTKFFTDRPQFHNTIDVLVTSHPHQDHLYGLPRLFPASGSLFKVLNIVDNGQTGTTGSLGVQTTVRNSLRAAGAKYAAVQLASNVWATGATNDVIDPIKCSSIDPIITAFWGSRNPSLNVPLPSDADTNPNVHSVVIRVDFGAASMLFTGDLMKTGLADMLNEYKENPGVFDVDVYLAGHHGADNGTTAKLLSIATPKIAVISMGDQSTHTPSTAFNYGHPKISTLKLLQATPGGVSFVRTPVTFWGSNGANTPFMPFKVTKAIYATGWEGTINLHIKSDGTYQVVP